MKIHAPNIDEIYWQASQVTDASERAAYLDRVCGDANALRDDVEKLLRAQSKAERFLEQPPAAQFVGTINRPSASERVGTQIGPYTLRELIAEGGMGMVYLAEQIKPVRRKVALKVIRPGMDSKEVIARFEAERQALAMMDHPNIARVFDAGVADSGRPYFVMELVQGIPVTEYCDEHRLSTGERMRLFVSVCRAVQHAHQKGIIHRDIKPSNVLVAEIDGAAVPKVIDFGVAKAISQRLTKHTLYTQFSQLVGTPLYMSPEQAGLGVVDVDTRSDVYSLGVLLYELATGSTPFDQESLKLAGLDEFRRIIREVEPCRPSTIISRLQAQARSTVAANRRTDPRKVRDGLKGEVDWLVMKALEKDRNRRYESASALAADVERFLDGEAVQACPPSFAYRWRKYIRRHKAALATVMSLAVVLIVATVVSSTMAAWAFREQRLAQTRLTESRQNERLANQERLAAINARALAEHQEQFAVQAEKQSMANLRLALQALDECGLAISGKNRLLLRNTENAPTDAQNRLLQHTLNFYEKFADQNADNRTLRFDVATAHSRAARIQIELGWYQRATSTISDAVAILEEPANAESWNILGEMHVQMAWLQDRLGREQQAMESRFKALAAFEEVIHFAPRNRSGYYGRALVYGDLDDLELAHLELNRLLGLDPNIVNSKGFTHHNYNDVAWFLVMCPNKELRDAKRAVKLARIAHTLNPEFFNYQNTLGVALYRAGSLEEVIELLTPATNVLDLLPLALAHWKLGHKDQARELYHKSTPQLDPRTGFSMNTMSGKDVAALETLFAEARALGIPRDVEPVEDSSSSAERNESSRVNE